MINDLRTRGVIPSKKCNCSGYPDTLLFSSFFLQIRRSQKPRTVLTRLRRIC